MWDSFSELLIRQDVLGHLSSSLLWFLVLAFFRFFFIRALRRSKGLPMEVRRRWVVQVKNIVLILFLVGLVIIWAAELRSFAVSLVAVAAALAIITKEFILCIIGGVYRASTRAFDIGDRIEVGGVRGDVVDHDLLRTSLYEIGPGDATHQYTGKMIELPNSLLLSQVTAVEKRARYVLHDFRIPIDIETVKWKPARDKLLVAAQSVCSEYVAEAQAYLNRLGEVEGIEPPNATPRVTMHFADAKTIDLLVRVPAPGLRKTRVEQEIVERYLEAGE